MCHLSGILSCSAPVIILEVSIEFNGKGHSAFFEYVYYVLLLVGRQCPFAVADSIIGAAAGVVDDTAAEEALLPGGEVFQDSEENSGVSHLLVGTEIGTSVGRSG